MSPIQRNSKVLEKWILVEAFKNGQARRGGTCSAGPNAVEHNEGYYVSRYAVYQRFFKLPIDAFFQGGTGEAAARRSVASRLRYSALLCESVRALLKEGLIWFPGPTGSSEPKDGSAHPMATLIFLTSDGIWNAERLLASAREKAGRTNGADPAYALSAS